jgi:hypothetical protein
MVITCDRCARRAQIAMPRIGSRLRCTSCDAVQVFGDRQKNVPGRDTCPRRRREVHRIVRFSDRAPAPGQKVGNAHDFDDPLGDLFAIG